MTTKNQHTRTVPTSALRFEAELLPCDAKTHEGDTTRAPVRILARTADVIETPYWGRIVHDLTGMELRKARTPIDYAHDGEPIGFADETTQTARGLELFAEIVSTQPGDRADQVIRKATAGIPYEASIDWNGPGTVLEELGENETAEVNGREFTGPGFIARAWPLRSVAICPYGADPGTASQFSETDTETQQVLILRKAHEMTAAHLDKELPEDQPQNDTPAESQATEKQPEPAQQQAAAPQPVPATVAQLKEMCSGAPEEFDANDFIVDQAGQGNSLEAAIVAYTRRLERFAKTASDIANDALQKVSAFDRGEEHPVAFSHTAEQAEHAHPLAQFISIPSRKRRGNLN